jgi:hypothetical protein
MNSVIESLYFPNYKSHIDHRMIKNRHSNNNYVSKQEKLEVKCIKNTNEMRKMNNYI